MVDHPIIAATEQLGLLAAALLLGLSASSAAAWPAPGNVVITGEVEVSVPLSVEDRSTR